MNTQRDRGPPARVVFVDKHYNWTTRGVQGAGSLGLSVVHFGKVMRLMGVTGGYLLPA